MTTEDVTEEAVHPWIRTGNYLTSDPLSRHGNAVVCTWKWFTLLRC